MESPPRRRLLDWLLGYPGAVALVLIYAGLALSASRYKNVHCDEVLHVVAGYSYWVQNDYRTQPENGNLPQRWAALPYLLTRPTPPDLENPDFPNSGTEPLGRKFLYDEPGNDGDWLLLQARFMIVLMAMALGLLVYAWSRQLFGPAGGIISLVLYVFTPTVLANGAIATSDLAASLFFLASTYYLWGLLREVTWRSLLLSTLAMTGLFLSKYSAGLIVPIGLLMVIVRAFQTGPFRVRFGQRLIEVRGLLRATGLIVGLVLIHVFVVWVGIWAAHGFRYAIVPPTAPAHAGPFPEWKVILALDSKPTLEAVQWCRRHEILPEAYLYGLTHTLSGARIRTAFLEGEIRHFGWRSFFPLTFLWKTPLPVFLIMLLALLGWCLSRPSRNVGRPSQAVRTAWEGRPTSIVELAPVLILWAVYWVAAITSHLNIGHRHILPTYPPLFILCGAAGLWFRRAKDPRGSAYLTPGLGVLVAISLLWQIGETLFYYPHYLSYFNQIVGGPSQGYHYLVDSSCDWGQDLKSVKTWLDEHPTDEPAYYFYFGSGSARYYRLPVEKPFGLNPYRYEGRIVLRDCKPGVYCVGATFLQNVYGQFPGHWNEFYEKKNYQLDRTLFNILEGRVDPNDPAFKAIVSTPEGKKELDMRIEQYRQSPKDQQELAAHLNWLTNSRLMHYLRSKQPIAQVGYSVLIYHLTQEDLDKAFNEPLADVGINITEINTPARYQVNGNGGPDDQVVEPPTVLSSSAHLPADATTIAISGQNFSTTPAENLVEFNLGASGTVTQATPTQLTVTFTQRPTLPPGLADAKLLAKVTVSGLAIEEPVPVAIVKPPR